MWVLRDFGLKLLDKKRNPISSKEYLENALAEIPANNKSASEKNEARALLKNCFPDRDCITMARPAIEEDELQIVNSMSLS